MQYDENKPIIEDGFAKIALMGLMPDTSLSDKKKTVIAYDIADLMMNERRQRYMQREEW